MSSQGITNDGEYFYFSGTKNLGKADMETGEIDEVFSRNIGAAFVAEGMTVYADKKGEPVFCGLDRGERRQSSNLTFYKLTQ